jgi:MHS family proline/betaine transporter-like MFS transporter
MVVALVLLFSPLADRIGLRRAMIIGPVVLIVLVIPGFALAGHGVIGASSGRASMARARACSPSPCFSPSVRSSRPGYGSPPAASDTTWRHRSSAGPPPSWPWRFNRGTGNSLRFALYLIVFAVVTLIIALVKGRTWVADSEEYSGGISGGTRTQVASRSTT